MITNNELNTVKLSPTKKDFYQIWNELIDVAGKISERWDPASTNESDPGIVLLKVLTAVADKLNYNIDANTLEAFMPSAAQEDSMRKLTEMLGYTMKYYQSATTEVKISYTGDDTDLNGVIVKIDKFTNIKDIDDSINYITLNDVNLNKDNSSGNVLCMEGELVECETDDNNIVSIFHLDDNKRYFLPETQIAENGIFITNIENTIEGDEWQVVDNLNAQSLGSKIYKFGFDSQEGLPYVQFPEDISTIIEDGLKIKYVRTNGLSGNISVNTLSKMEPPISWAGFSKESYPYYDVTKYRVANIYAATNGANKEGINAAYNNFKKTIGTFNTLVTCRDYMNRIYQMVSETDKTTPLVSNVIVSDIRDDINRAVTVGTFTNHGIEYRVMAKKDANDKDSLTHFDLMIYPFKSTYGLNSRAEFDKSFTYDTTNLPEIKSSLEENKTLAHRFVSPTNQEIACIENYYKLRAKITTVRKVGSIEQISILKNVYSKLFEHFNMRQLDFGEEIPYDTLLQVIETADPRIKNVSLDEPELTLKFRTVDNEEHDILSVTSGEETTDEEETADGEEKKENLGKQLYNKLVLNNVLAGRVPLFNYNEDFKPEYNESKYPAYPSPSPENPGKVEEYKTEYPFTPAADEKQQNIYKIKTNLSIPREAIINAALKGNKGLTLLDNEIVQFRARNFKTTLTYPAYVNYYLYLNKTNAVYTQAIPAAFQTFRDFLYGGGDGIANGIIKDKDGNKIIDPKEYALEYYANSIKNSPYSSLIAAIEINNDVRGDWERFENQFNKIVSDSVAVFYLKDNRYTWLQTVQDAWANRGSTGNWTQFYTFNFTKEATGAGSVIAWKNWLTTVTPILDAKDEEYPSTKTVDRQLKGFYTQLATNYTQQYGLLVDIEGTKYKLLNVSKTISSNPFEYYLVPRIWSGQKLNSDITNLAVDAAEWHTLDSLGQDASSTRILKGTEYQLKADEFLLIQYSKSADNEDGEPTPVQKTYITGKIIKPNFDLYDSEDWYNRGHSFTKHLTGVFPGDFKNSSGEGIQKMFTLGTSEQIEIREAAQVELNQLANIYWVLQNENAFNGTRIDFPFDSDPVYFTDNTYTEVSDTSTEFIKYLTYTLKEGEYFYYTDMNKSDIAFYGVGTTIQRKLKTPDIFKYSTDDLISAEQISSAGLSAAIPWRTYDFRAEDASLVLQENQYINLTAGDSLISCGLKEGQAKITSDSFIPVTGASYQLSTSSASSSLPPIDITGYSWEVCSRLNLNVGPTTPQTIHTRDFEGHQVVDQITLISTDKFGTSAAEDNDIVTLEAKKINDVYYPLSIKTNRLIQSTSVVTDVIEIKKDLNTNSVKDVLANLRLKVFEQKDLKEGATGTGRILNLNNFGDGTYTEINFQKITTDQEKLTTNPDNTSVTPISFNLNILIPEKNFGLMMLYYQNLSDGTKGNTATISIDSDNEIAFFNSDDAGSSGKSLTLKEGINIVKIPNSGALTISSEDNLQSNLIFSSLDIIHTDDTLNPKLCYKQITEGTPYEQILKDIKGLGTDIANNFYYNIPIAGNIDIDMNPNDEKDTLENPLNWFNYNNINNKFVIAKLDTSTLADGITIAKASRSNY